MTGFAALAIHPMENEKVFGLYERGKKIAKIYTLYVKNFSYSSPCEERELNIFYEGSGWDISRTIANLTTLFILYFSMYIFFMVLLERTRMFMIRDQEIGKNECNKIAAI